LLIGFAAETENLLEEARRKMNAKKCDMLVANLVNREGLGFESDQNEVEIISRSGQIVHAGPAGKKEIAERILDQVATLRLSLHEVDTPA
jgi:phosphopantothenoylcysteine decarboxylase/phosphopantothenate--cysteine ligase